MLSANSFGVDLTEGLHLAQDPVSLDGYLRVSSMDQNEVCQLEGLTGEDSPRSTAMASAEPR